MSGCGYGSLGSEIIGFDSRTGQAVQAAAGMGSYAELNRDFYQTYSPHNWQHPGSKGWSAAPVPGWGNNPLMAGPPRIAVGQEGKEDVDSGITFFIWTGAILGLWMITRGYFEYQGAKRRQQRSR